MVLALYSGFCGPPQAQKWEKECSGTSQNQDRDAIPRKPIKLFCSGFCSYWNPNLRTFSFKMFSASKTLFLPRRPTFSHQCSGSARSYHCKAGDAFPWQTCQSACPPSDKDRISRRVLQQGMNHQSLLSWCAWIQGKTGLMKFQHPKCLFRNQYWAAEIKRDECLKNPPRDRGEMTFLQTGGAFGRAATSPGKRWLCPLVPETCNTERPPRWPRPGLVRPSKAAAAAARLRSPAAPPRGLQRPRPWQNPYSFLRQSYSQARGFSNIHFPSMDKTSGQNFHPGLWLCSFWRMPFTYLALRMPHSLVWTFLGVF